MEKEDPQVLAILTLKNKCFQWQVRCPYCDEVHLHGAGTEGKEVESFLGHRVSHCCSKGYVLGDSGVESAGALLKREGML